jgi:hypothetical protein
MIDPFISALWGFILIPYVLYCFFEKYGKFLWKFLHIILGLTLMAIIGTIITWLSILL